MIAGSITPPRRARARRPSPSRGGGAQAAPSCFIAKPSFAYLLLFFLLFSIVVAQAFTFPTLSGRVVDEASILDQAARAALTQKLAALEAKTTDQLVVATVKSLEGTSVEDYGNRLFREW